MMDDTVNGGADGAPAEASTGPDKAPSGGAQINIVLSSKGGVGKSFISGILAEYHLMRGSDLLALDVDPSNKSLSRITGLGAEALPLGQRRDEIDERRFDSLIERLLALPGGGVAILDTGSNAFPVLCEYLWSYGVIALLREAGHEVRFHCVLAGGSRFVETLGSVSTLMDRFHVPTVVWINEHFGVAAVDGERFEDSALFEGYKSRIVALVRLEKLRERTFGQDLDDMMAEGLTFHEGMAFARFDVMARQRIKMAWDRYRAAMAEAGL